LQPVLGVQTLFFFYAERLRLCLSRVGVAAALAPIDRFLKPLFKIHESPTQVVANGGRQVVRRSQARLATFHDGVCFGCEFWPR
jgi:hypothetical protein